MAIKRRIKNKGFNPIDLNEHIVQGIFDECLAVDNTTINRR